MNRQKQPLSKSERKLYWVSGGAITFFVGFATIWNWLHAVPQVNIPTPTMPHPNGYNFFRGAVQSYVPPAPPIALYAYELHSDPGSMEPSDPAIIDPAAPGPVVSPKLYSTTEKEIWLRRNAESLSLLRQGLQYPSQHPAIRSFDYSFPDYLNLREVARLLVAESRVNAERGDWPGAADSALDNIQLGHKVPHGGTAVVGQNGLFIQVMGIEELQKILPHLDAHVARRAVTRMEQLHVHRVMVAQALEEEKWMVQASMLEAMRRRGWHLSLFGNYPEDDSVMMNLRMRLVSKQAIMRRYTELMDANIAMARRPYKTRQDLSLPDDLVTKQLAPNFDGLYWRWAQAETYHVTVMTMLALRAFRLEQGRYPEKLNELVPEYLKQVPADPYGGGEPLRYRETNGKYTLWSIGPDKTDDQGKPALDSRPQDRGPQYVYPETKGDVVVSNNQP